MCSFAVCFSSRRRHTRLQGDWSSDVCSSDLLAFIASAVPALAGNMEPASIRNCTWCHGESAQGYAPAPRLAGQRHQYTENQLLSFRAHTRDNPFSKQYMWGAAANLSPSTTH